MTDPTDAQVGGRDRCGEELLRLVEGIVRCNLPAGHTEDCIHDEELDGEPMADAQVGEGMGEGE